MIEQLADKGDITYSQLGAINLTEPLRHSAETALVALYELADAKARHRISLVAARFYRQLGVGYEILKRQVALAEKNDLTNMLLHLGGNSLEPRISTVPSAYSNSHPLPKTKPLRDSRMPTSIAFQRPNATRQWNSLWRPIADLRDLQLTLPIVSLPKCRITNP